MLIFLILQELAQDKNKRGNFKFPIDKYIKICYNIYRKEKRGNKNEKKKISSRF